MSFLSRLFSADKRPVPPVSFSLLDDQERVFVYDATYRSRKNSVLVWYRGHW